MDVRTDTEDSTLSIAAGDLLALHGTHRWPLVVDARRAPAYEADRTMIAGAIAFDTPDAPIGHHGDRCSFDALIREFGLDDPALAMLAPIVRGADTGASGLAPQVAGLTAISAGLAMLQPDDHAMLEAGMAIYDALFAWSRAQAAASGRAAVDRPSAVAGAVER